MLDEHCQTALSTAELAFSRLEAKAELAFEHLMQRVLALHTRIKLQVLPMERHEIDVLRRFFIFIRYRNSAKYSFMLSKMVQTVTWENNSGRGVLLSVWHRIRRQQALSSIYGFLDHASASASASASTTASEDINRYCWNMLGAEVSLGVALEGQEFVLTDNCIGSLDACFRDDP